MHTKISKHVQQITFFACGAFMQARGIELYALMLSDKVDFNGCQAKTTNSTV